MIFFLNISPYTTQFVETKRLKTSIENEKNDEIFIKNDKNMKS